MKLKNLEIYNVGPYRERNMFSFNDSSIDKPIILIRGHNGAGKTHVFDSIRYCLFGKRVLNGSKEQDFLSDFTYKPKDENFKLTDSSSYVELTIEDPIENSEFTIKRGWKKNKEIDSILELEIREEGEDATAKIKDQDAQNYIDRLIREEKLEVVCMNPIKVTSRSVVKRLISLQPFLEYAVPSRLDYAVRQHEVHSW